MKGNRADTTGSGAQVDDDAIGAGRAGVEDHIGPPRDPYRVTILRLARVKETYELRWRENIRLEDGAVVRERRTEPGGHSKALAYTKAEKIHRNLDRSAGYHGRPPRPAPEEARTGPAKSMTIRRVSELWLAQHPSNATKPATVEGYESVLRNNVWTRLTYTETRTTRTHPAGHRTATGKNAQGTGAARATTIDLGAMIAEDVTLADINRWTNALAQKPDGRTKLPGTTISSSTINSCLRILTACLNWGVAHGYLTHNPAAGVEVTVHGARQPEWFRTDNDFWAALDAIDTKYDHALHNALVTAVYLGLRVNELAALRRGDIDFPRARINIRHNFDKKRRPSTVKSAESETWLPLHPETDTAIKTEIANTTRPAPTPPAQDVIFRGPRGGIITSTLINDALEHGCQKAELGYRVTAHGLRHSFANWLKAAHVPAPDIQALLRHRDQRTTAGYLHTSAEDKINAIAALPQRQHA